MAARPAGETEERTDTRIMVEPGHDEERGRAPAGVRLGGRLEEPLPIAVVRERERRRPLTGLSLNSRR